MKENLSEFTVSNASDTQLVMLALRVLLKQVGGHEQLHDELLRRGTPTLCCHVCAKEYERERMCKP